METTRLTIRPHEEEEEDVVITKNTGSMRGEKNEHLHTCFGLKKV